MPDHRPGVELLLFFHLAHRRRRAARTGSCGRRTAAGADATARRRRRRQGAAATASADRLLDGHEHLTHLDDVTVGRVELRDAARPRRREFHHRLVRLHLRQRLVLDDDVALLHFPGQELTLGDPLAHIREFELEGHD